MQSYHSLSREDGVCGYDGNSRINRTHGTLNGTISLWDGNDVFDNRGGSIGNHSVQGGYGNDTFILDSKIAIVENVGEGTDTIKSTITMPPRTPRL